MRSIHGRCIRPGEAGNTGETAPIRNDPARQIFRPPRCHGRRQGPHDAAVVARNATYLDLLGKMAWDGFDPGTSGEKSRALPEIYKEPAKFKEAADKFQVEIGKLVVASKSGNESAAKNAIGDIGKACSACHDDFRSK